MALPSSPMSSGAGPAAAARRHGLHGWLGCRELEWVTDAPCPRTKPLACARRSKRPGPRCSTCRYSLDLNQTKMAFSELKAIPERSQRAPSMTSSERTIADAFPRFSVEESCNYFKAAGYAPVRTETALVGRRRTRLFKTRLANRWLVRRRHNPRHDGGTAVLVAWRGLSVG